jgi:oligoendopeptidase F
MDAVLTPRAEVPAAQTWNAESVFASHDAWKAEYAAVAEALKAVAAYSGTLSQSPVRLADWLELVQALARRVMKLYFYGAMSAAVNTNDVPAKALLGQAGALYGQFSAVTAFANPEIIAMGREAVMAMIAAEPRLAVYRQWADDLFRQQAHVRSQEVEEVLGLINDPLRGVEEIASELANTDLVIADALDSAGKPFRVTQATVWTAQENPDRALRRSAWNNYNDAYLAFKNTFAQALITAVKQRVALARIRRYDSVLEAQLSQHNLPVSVFHNLIDTFKANIGTWHRFWDVKRRVLGYDTLHPYDIWAPMTHKPPAVTYQQAVDWICEGMKPLGDEYVHVMRQGCLENRWVDYALSEGKRQGAFSYGTYDTMPFIMMSFDGGLGAMSTLAHELGHSMHSYYSKRHQPFVYSDYSIFLAEVASNFNQAMTRAYLFRQFPDRDFKLALIQEAIDNFHRYFFIMPTLARFEYEVYSRAERDEPLTVDHLMEIMSGLYAEGYGATMTDDPGRTAMTWAQFGHLYEPYYTFQYATGISAAHALSADILAGVPGSRERYIQLLSAGCSAYPLDVLQAAGADMRTPAVVEKTYGVLARMVDELESLI